MQILQPFIPAESGHLGSVAFRLAAIAGGGTVGVSLYALGARGPEGNPIAATMAVAATTTSDTVSTFADLPYLTSGEQYCIVWSLPDGMALAVSEAGKYDPVSGRYATASSHLPDARSSADGGGWSAMRGMAAYLRLKRPRFGQHARAVDISAIDADEAISIYVDLEALYPTAVARVDLLITLPNGRQISATPGGRVDFPAAVSGRINVSAILRGGEHETPTVFPGGQIILGRRIADADYVSRAFACGDNRTLRVEQVALTTGDASSAPSYQDGAGAWRAMTLKSWEEAGDGWRALYYEAAGVSAPTTRIKLDLHGSPGHRPLVDSLVALPLAI